MKKGPRFLTVYSPTGSPVYLDCARLGSLSPEFLCYLCLDHVEIQQQIIDAIRDPGVLFYLYFWFDKHPDKCKVIKEDLLERALVSDTSISDYLNGICSRNIAEVCIDKILTREAARKWSKVFPTDKVIMSQRVSRKRSVKV